MAINEFLVGLAAFLATYLIHSTLMHGGVLLLRSSRRLGTGTLETLHRAALVAPLLTSILAVNFPVAPINASLEWFQQRENIVRSAETATQLKLPAPPAASLPLPREQGLTGQAPLPSTETAPAAASPATQYRVEREWRVLPLLAGLIALTWLAVAALLSARWVRGARAGRRLLAGRERLRHGPVHSALATLAQRADLPVPRLSVSERVAGPATLPTGEICIPAWALELPPAQLEAMLAHELAHVERRDPWWLAVAVSLESLFWLQPMNRIVRRRLAALAELHADARGAQLTNDGRALARCLAQCAERMSGGPMPVLAAAMARQGGPLSERVRKLISGSLETGGIPMSRRFMIFAGALALVLVLPSVAVMANKAAGKVAVTNSSVSIHENDNGARSMSLSISQDDFRLKLEAQGDIVFAPDDSGIEHMGRGASLEIEHEEDGTKRRLLAEGTGSGIDYRYFVDGDEQGFEPDGRAWLAEVLPMVMRETAINAPQRVDYILANDGHEGVLAEIGRIRSDYARRVYIEAYTLTGELPASAYRGVLKEAGKLGSDYEQRLALMSIYTSQSPRGERLAALIETSDGIGSDYEMRQFLSVLSEDAMNDEQVMEAYAEAATSIGSDYELRQALELMMDAGAGPLAVELALPVAKGISSDFEMRSLLQKAAPQAARNDAAAGAWLQAAATIGSDFELRQALEAMAEEQPQSTGVWTALLDTARAIGSDHECSSFLIKAARFMPDDPGVREAFDRALATVGSEYDSSRVARAMER